jgi:predicted DNA-binding transcriptional regulator AlpA
MKLLVNTQETQPVGLPYYDDSLLTLKDIIAGEERILPVSKSFFYNCVADGRIPEPIKLGKKSVWRYGDIRRFVNSLR